MALDYTSTYDLTTAVGQVRFVIQDVDVTTTPPDALTDRADWSCLFVDQEIAFALSQHTANATNLAGADLLDYIANNTALLAKMITIGDYSEDTRGVAAQLHKQADALRHKDDLVPAESITDLPWTDANWARIALRPTGG